jgi:hypothetical protein
MHFGKFQQRIVCLMWLRVHHENINQVGKR